jgi:hypothetical protein
MDDTEVKDDDKYIHLFERLIEAVEKSKDSSGFQRIVQYGVDESGTPVAMPIREDGLSTTGGSSTGTSSSNTVTKLAAASLGTSAATIYTATASVTDMMVVFCNTDTVARTFTFYHVDSGGSASASNALFTTYNLRPGASVALSGFGMANGEILQGLGSSASKITATVYGAVV